MDAPGGRKEEVLVGVGFHVVVIRAGRRFLTRSVTARVAHRTSPLRLHFHNVLLIAHRQ